MKTITKESRLMTLQELKKLISYLKDSGYESSACFPFDKSEFNNDWWKKHEEIIDGNISKRYAIHVAIFAQLGNKFMVEVELQVYTYEAYIPHMVSIKRTVKTVDQLVKLSAMLPKLQDLYSSLLAI